MAERWQKRSGGYPYLHWFVLCRRCDIPCGYCHGLEAKPAGYVCILSPEYLSAASPHRL
ncbi:hypothetical protein BJV78DRAFT_1264148 [Lactifluus subvellereus]|nr:hypothetical protein BJV78DRAFT_1264148 [Lactifluus subvellereus]